MVSELTYALNATYTQDFKNDTKKEIYLSVIFIYQMLK